MYDLEEEIIDKLEEIDITFSKINNVLQSIKLKLNKNSKKNKQIINDFRKYFNLFDIKKQERSLELENEFSKSISLENLKYNLNELNESNPFDSSLTKEVSIENEEEEEKLETKSFEIPDSLQTEPFYIENKKIKHNESRLFISDLSSSLIKINDVELPNVFKGDNNLLKVYDFIKESKTIKYSKVLEYFKEIDNDILEVYIQLFISKHLIRCKNGILSV